MLGVVSTLIVEISYYIKVDHHKKWNMLFYAKTILTTLGENLSF